MTTTFGVEGEAASITIMLPLTATIYHIERAIGYGRAREIY